MCGRFSQTATGEELAREFGLAEVPVVSDRYNVAPSQSVLLIRAAAKQGRRFAWHTWGLVPRWARDPAMGARLINARSETAAEKPAFGRAMRQQRCLIPATGFYEWARRGPKRGPVWFCAQGEESLGLAGLWERWSGSGEASEGDETGSADELWTCTILTTAANDRVRPIHQRMPVILRPQAFARWLDPETKDPKLLVDLLVPCGNDVLEAIEVSTAVNDPATEGPVCIEPRSPRDPGPLFG